MHLLQKLVSGFNLLRGFPNDLRGIPNELRDHATAYLRGNIYNINAVGGRASE